MGGQLNLYRSYIFLLTKSLKCCVCVCMSGGVDNFFLPVLEVGDRWIKSGYLKIPGSWISAGIYVDIVS